MSPHLHTFVGAYALDALDPQERTEFEQHLATCGTCCVEMDELVETAALLGSTAEVVPPEDMRTRVLDAVARTQQERPTVVSLQEHRSRRWPTRALGTAAALLIVLGVGVGADQYAANRDLREQQAAQAVENQQLRQELAAQADQDALVADVLTADDQVAYDTQSASGLHLTVVRSQDEDAAVVSLRDLPDVAEGRSYQLWRLTDEGAQSAGVIGADQMSRNRATILVQDVGDTKAIAVTEEPAGGSEQPTTDPLVDLQLPA